MLPTFDYECPSCRLTQSSTTHPSAEPCCMRCGVVLMLLRVVRAG